MKRRVVVVSHTGSLEAEVYSRDSSTGEWEITDEDELRGIHLAFDGTGELFAEIVQEFGPKTASCLAYPCITAW